MAFLPDDDDPQEIGDEEIRRPQPTGALIQQDNLKQAPESAPTPTIEVDAFATGTAQQPEQEVQSAPETVRVAPPRVLGKANPQVQAIAQNPDAYVAQTVEEPKIYHRRFLDPRAEASQQARDQQLAARQQAQQQREEDRRASKIVQGLKQQGVDMETDLQTGAQSPKLDEKGNVIYKPGPIQPLTQQADGRWTKTQRDRSGNEVEIEVKPKTDPLTGERYVEDGGIRTPLGTDKGFLLRKDATLTGQELALARQNAAALAAQAKEAKKKVEELNSAATDVQLDPKLSDTDKRIKVAAIQKQRDDLVKSQEPLRQQHEAATEQMRTLQEQYSAKQTAALQETRDRLGLRPAPPKTAPTPVVTQKPTGQVPKEGDVAATLDAVQKAPLGFFDRFKEVGANPLELVPFLGGGKALVDMAQVGLAANRLRLAATDGTTPDQADINLVKEFSERNQRDTTFGYKVASLVAAIPSFAGEVLATAGIYTVGERLALKAGEKALSHFGSAAGVKLLATLSERAAAKAAGREVAEVIGKTGATKAAEFVARGAASAVGSAAQLIPASGLRIGAETIERMLPTFKFSESEKGMLSAEIQKQGDDFGPALAKAFGNQYTEVMSERTGGALAFVPGAEKLKLLKAAITQKWFGANPGARPGTFKKLLAKTGWNGVLGEMFEERVGDVTKSAMGLQSWSDAVPSLEQLAVEAVGFSVPGAAVGATNMLLNRKKGGAEGGGPTAPGETTTTTAPTGETPAAPAGQATPVGDEEDQALLADLNAAIAEDEAVSRADLFEQNDTLQAQIDDPTIAPDAKAELIRQQQAVRQQIAELPEESTATPSPTTTSTPAAAETPAIRPGAEGDQLLPLDSEQSSQPNSAIQDEIGANQPVPQTPSASAESDRTTPVQRSQPAAQGEEGKESGVTTSAQPTAEAPLSTNENSNATSAVPGRLPQQRAASASQGAQGQEAIPEGTQGADAAGQGVAAAQEGGVTLPEGLTEDDVVVARTIMGQEGKASTSLLQRRLRMPYVKARALMEELNRRGHIEGYDGTARPFTPKAAGATPAPQVAPKAGSVQSTETAAAQGNEAAAPLEGSPSTPAGEAPGTAARTTTAPESEDVPSEDGDGTTAEAQASGEALNSLKDRGDWIIQGRYIRPNKPLGEKWTTAEQDDVEAAFKAAGIYTARSKFMSTDRLEDGWGFLVSDADMDRLPDPGPKGGAKSAKGLLQKILFRGKAKKTLDAMGVEIRQQADDRGMSAEFGKDGSIWLNVDSETLDRRMEGKADREQFISTALSEEIKHIASLITIRDAWLAAKKKGPDGKPETFNTAAKRQFKEIHDSLAPEQKAFARDTYGDPNAKDWHIGAEFIRQLLQVEEGETPTEAFVRVGDNATIRAFINRMLAVLKRFLDNRSTWSQPLQDAYDATKAVLARAEKGESAKPEEINSGDWISYRDQSSKEHTGKVQDVWRVGRIVPTRAGMQAEKPRLEYSVVDAAGNYLPTPVYDVVKTAAPTVDKSEPPKFSVGESVIVEDPRPSVPNQVGRIVGFTNNGAMAVVQTSDGAIHNRLTSTLTAAPAAASTPEKKTPSKATSTPQKAKGTAVATSPQDAPAVSRAKPINDDAKKALDDAFEGLSLPPSNGDSIEQAELPSDKLGAFASAAKALIDSGITTPQEMAAVLDERFQKRFRKYSEALWDAFGMVKRALRGSHDWDAIYSELDNSAETEESSVKEASVGDQVEKLLAEGETVSRRKLSELAQGSGLSTKEVDEAAEAAVVRVGRDLVKAESGSAESKFDRLLDLYNRQPNLTAKTSTSKIQQAYSTPIPLAYVGSRLAEVSEGGVMQESTAGNGALAIEADPKTALINEIDPTRAAALRAQGFTVSTEDATAWKPARKAKRININPPFGQIRGENGEWLEWTVDGITTTQIDHAISLRTLANMEDDGTAVLIIGGTQAQKENERIAHYGIGDRGEFFKHLYQNYGVIDHFTVDGDLYKKQGAGWPVDVITIRGKASSPIVLPNVQSPRILRTWDEIRAELSRTDNERIQINQYDEERARKQLGSDLTGIRGAFSSGERSGVEGDQTDATRGSGRAGADVGTTGGDLSRDVSDESILQPSTGRAGDVGIGEVDREPAGVEEKVFHAAYEPVAKGKRFGIETPINLAKPQRAALERVQEEVGMPLTEYVAGKLGYPDGTDISPYFAAEQIDALAMGIYNIEQGGALIVGDMAGIGKGRVAAGLIEYGKQKGMVPVFVTKEPKLYAAMLGDVDNIGRKVNPVMTNSDLQITNPVDGSNIRQGSTKKLMEQISREGKLAEGKDVVFTTYDQIGKELDPTETKESRESAKSSGGVPRPGPRNLALQRLVQEGKTLFILDESHLAAGDSIVGRRMRALIERSAVYYSSATFSKRPDAMPLYFRTNLRLATTGGLNSLIPVFEKGGVVMQQVATQMLAEDGQLLRRERSYKGVTFETHINYDTEERDRRLGDQYTEGLRGLMDMSRRIEKATKSLNGILAKLGKKMGVSIIKLESSDFASQVHNFVAQYLFAIKAEAAVQQAVKAIKEGHPTQDGSVKKHKVIIALQNTMQSPISALAESGMPVSFNGLLLKALEGLRTMTSGKGENKKTMTISRTPNPDLANLSSSQLEQMMIETKTIEVNGVMQTVGTVREDMAMEYFRRQANAEFERAEEEMRDLDLGDMPISPIDYILDSLKAKGIRTGEITGRTKGFRDGATYERDAEEVTKRGQLRTLDQFNNSNLDALIINASGSTGVSAHASETFKRKDPRQMIIVQPHLDINEFIQTLGRIFRSGQVEMPRYMLLQTALPAEKRPAAITGKKMAALNANTTSNAESEVSSGTQVVDMFNEYGDEVVWRYLADNPAFLAALNWPKIVSGKTGALLPLDAIKEVMEDEPGKLSRSTASYAAILPVEDQEAFWDKVVADYNAMIAYLDQIGENKMRVSVEDIGAETVDRKPYTEGNPSGKSVFDKPSFLETVKIKPKQPPYAVEDVERIGREAAGRKDGLLSEFRQRASEFAQEYLARRAERTPENWSEVEPREKARLNEQAGVIASAIRLLGEPVIFNTVEGKRVAIVTGFEPDPKAPLTPSKQIVVLSTNTLKRELKMPVSQLAERVGPLERDVLEEQFNESREDKTGRQIITGNLVAAFAKLQGTGKVVTYTKSDGTTATGIMLPNGFDADAQSAEQLTKPSQIQDALKEGQDVQSRDGLITFELRNGAVWLRVPSSKSAGGRFWQDPAINRAMKGGQMEQSGSSMGAAVDNLKAVLDRLTQMDVQIVAKGNNSLGLPLDPYAGAAASTWLEHDATRAEKPSGEEVDRILAAYAEVRRETGFDAVPIADVLERSGYTLETAEAGKGALISMLRSGEVQTFSRGDWSLADFRKRAWGLNERARTAYEPPSLMVRMAGGDRLSAPPKLDASFSNDVYYHGTRNGGFTEFNGPADADIDYNIPGTIYFTKNRETAERYASNGSQRVRNGADDYSIGNAPEIYSTRLDLKRPLDFSKRVTDYDADQMEVLAEVGGAGDPVEQVAEWLDDPSKAPKVSKWLSADTGTLHDLPMEKLKGWFDGISDPERDVHAVFDSGQVEILRREPIASKAMEPDASLQLEAKQDGTFDAEDPSILSAPPESETQPSADKLASLKAAVADLPEMQRKVLTMRIAKKDAAVIQKATGLSASGVENAYQIALGKMRRAREKALAVEALRQEAMGEEGQRTIGRPELANPAKGPASRMAMDAVDEARKRAGVPGVRKDAEVEQQAIARLDSDFEAEKKSLLDRGRTGGMLSDVETVMAKRIVARGTLKWVRQKDENSILEGVMLADAWRVTGTEQARAFRLRRDAVLTPAQRFAEFVSEAILSPDTKRQKALDEARKNNDRDKREQILKDWVKQLEKIKAKLKALGIDLDNMTDADLRKLGQNPGKAQQALRAIQHAKADTFDKVYEYWIMSVLSGIGSNAANLAGNISNAAFDLSLQRMAEVAVNLVVRDPKSAQAGEFAHLLKGVAPGWTRAARNMAQAWSAERPVFEEDVLGEPGDAKLENRGGAIGGKLGRFIRIPGRLLTAMDDWSKSMVATMQVQAEAYRQAKAEKLTGDDLSKRMAQLTRTPTEAAQAMLPLVDDAKAEKTAQALAKGDPAQFTDKTSDAWEQARLQEAYRMAEESGYDPSAWERAAEKAKELAFQEDVGPIGRSLSNAKKEYRVLGFFFPFVKTMSNILRIGFRKTPLGSVPLLYRVLRTGAARLNWGGQNWTYTRTDFVRHSAEQLIAWGAFFALKALTMPDDKEGVPTITGTTPYTPQNRGKRELSYRTAPPQSIRIGNRWYSYSRIEPFATGLSVTVDMMNAMEEPGADTTKRIGDLFTHLTGQLQEKTFAKGIGDIMRALQDGESAVEWVANFATSWVPNIIRQSARETDAMVREGKIWGKGDQWSDRLIERTLYKSLPLGTQAPPAKVDLWGNDIKKDTFGGPATDFLARVMVPVRTQKAGEIQKVDRLILNWNNQNPDQPYAPQQPAPAWVITRYGKRTTVPMSDGQYHTFLQLAGKQAAARLSIASLNVNKPTEQDMKAIVDVIAKSRKAARERVWQQKLAGAP